jgi:hypothetical protein
VYICTINNAQNKNIMTTIAKFRNIEQALDFRDRCFETAGKSLMVVLLEDFTCAITTRKEAARLEKLGYEVM